MGSVLSTKGILTKPPTFKNCVWFPDVQNGGSSVLFQPTEHQTALNFSLISEQIWAQRHEWSRRPWALWRLGIYNNASATRPLQSKPRWQRSVHQGGVGDLIVIGSLGQHRRKLGSHEAEMASDTRRVHPPRSGLYTALLSEALTCRNQTLKKIHMQIASHTKNPTTVWTDKNPICSALPSAMESFLSIPRPPRHHAAGGSSGPLQCRQGRDSAANDWRTVWWVNTPNICSAPAQILDPLAGSTKSLSLNHNGNRLPTRQVWNKPQRFRVLKPPTQIPGKGSRQMHGCPYG